MSGISFNRPSPPPLPEKDQREFEELVRQANAPLAHSSQSQSTTTTTSNNGVRLEQGEELHPDAKGKAIVPDFEGDVNPKTGERGGPKTEPLRHGDWSFGGRATDF